LKRYRARDFAGAAEKFAIAADGDPPSALFLARVRHFAQQSLGSEWEPVNVQEAS
jgi:adenylate cyclase